MIIHFLPITLFIRLILITGCFTFCRIAFPVLGYFFQKIRKKHGESQHNRYKSTNTHTVITFSNTKQQKAALLLHGSFPVFQN